MRAAAHAPAFEEEQEGDVVIAAEGLVMQRENADDRVAAVPRLGDLLLTASLSGAHDSLKIASSSPALPPK